MAFILFEGKWKNFLNYTHCGQDNLWQTNIGIWPVALGQGAPLIGILQ